MRGGGGGIRFENLTGRFCEAWSYVAKSYQKIYRDYLLD